MVQLKLFKYPSLLVISLLFISTACYRLSYNGSIQPKEHIWLKDKKILIINRDDEDKKFADLNYNTQHSLMLTSMLKKANARVTLYMNNKLKTINLRYELKKISPDLVIIINKATTKKSKTAINNTTISILGNKKSEPRSYSFAKKIRDELKIYNKKKVRIKFLNCFPKYKIDNTLLSTYGISPTVETTNNISNEMSKLQEKDFEYITSICESYFKAISLYFKRKEQIRSKFKK